MTEKEFNITIGIIMGSALPSEEKQELIGSIRALEKKVNSNSWIPCSERLPEKNTNVIACFSHGIVTEMRYEGNGIFQGIYEYSTDIIRAWQPLPEPYEEEQE